MAQTTGQILSKFYSASLGTKLDPRLLARVQNIAEQLSPLGTPGRLKTGPPPSLSSWPLRRWDWILERFSRRPKSEVLIQNQGVRGSAP